MRLKLHFLLLGAGLGFAAYSQTTPPLTPDWQGWSVTALDDCSHTRAYTNLVANPTTGEMEPEVHRIVEVATGLSFLDKASGEWRLSQDLIELTPDGGAAAVQGPHQVYFKPDLSSGITLVTKSNRVFVTKPALGLTLVAFPSAAEQIQLQ